MSNWIYTIDNVDILKIFFRSFKNDFKVPGLFMTKKYLKNLVPNFHFDKYRSYIKHDIYGHSKISYLLFCIDNKYLDVIKWLTTYCGYNKNDINFHTYKVLKTAIKTKDIDIIKWIVNAFNYIDNKSKIHSYDVLRDAIETNNIDIVTCIIKTFNYDESDIRGIENIHLVTLVNNDQLELMNDLKPYFGSENFFKFNDNYLLSHYIHKGNINRLNYLISIFKYNKNDILDNNYNVLKVSIKDGELCNLIWLVVNFNLKYDDITINNNYLFRYSAEKGYLHILQYLANNFNLTHDDIRSNSNYAIRHAVINKKLDVLMWIIDTYNITINDINSFDNYIITNVFLNGSVEILDILANKYDINTLIFDRKRLLSFAIQRGQLEVVRYFRSHFCTTDADIKEYNDIVDNRKKMLCILSSKNKRNIVLEYIFI